MFSRKSFSPKSFKTTSWYMGLWDDVIQRVRGAQVYVRTTLSRVSTWLVKAEARLVAKYEQAVVEEQTQQTTVQADQSVVSTRSFINRIRVLGTANYEFRTKPPTFVRARVHGSGNSICV